MLGAGLTVWSGVIHLQLWSQGYRDISVIGPLFLVQGIASIVLALALVVFRRVFLLAAGAALMVGTGVGLLLSATVGLFGYQESLAITDATDVTDGGVHRGRCARWGGCCAGRRPAAGRAGPERPGRVRPAQQDPPGSPGWTRSRNSSSSAAPGPILFQPPSVCTVCN